MTTIVVIEESDKVTFAADNRVTTGSQINDYTTKIVNNGGLVFAAAGYLKTKQLLEYANLPEPEAHDWDIDKYVTTELVPAVEDLFNETGDYGALEGSSILVAVRGRVYLIIGAGGCAWLRTPNGVYSIGSGSSYALGALAMGATATEAVEIASIYDKGTSGEVTTWDILND